MKPTESHFRERTVEELLRDVNFALSRSSVLASDLAPKLRKILGESSRGPKAKPGGTPGRRRIGRKQMKQLRGNKAQGGPGVGLDDLDWWSCQILRCFACVSSANLEPRNLVPQS